MKTVNKYRVWNGGAYDYIWSETIPQGYDANSVVIVDSVSDNDVSLKNINIDPYGDTRVTSKTPVIELKSCFGVSGLRDIVTVSGTGSVANVPGDSEYELTVLGGGDRAELRSAERGRYVSGFGAEVGIGIRFGGGEVLGAGQIAEWGLYDGNDGFLYRYVGGGVGLQLVIKRDGVETVIAHGAFNQDKMDGTGESGVVLNYTKGNVYNIQFSWYGYGVIDFRVVSVDSRNVQRYISLHRFVPSNSTSVKNPNLPLYACLKNDPGVAANGAIFVAGRQYSILGHYIPQRRLNCAFRTEFSVNSNSVFLPVLSIRRKLGYLGNGVKLSGADMISSSNQIVQIRVGGTLTGGTFVNINDQAASETCIEMNVTASAISGGIVLWCGLVASDRAALQQIESLMYDLTEYSVLSVCARAVTVTNGSLSTVLRWTEEW
jgi:hypothetical protein